MMLTLWKNGGQWDVQRTDGASGSVRQPRVPDTFLLERFPKPPNPNSTDWGFER